MTQFDIDLAEKILTDCGARAVWDAIEPTLKAQMDAMVFGSGWLRIDADGTSKHIPGDQIFIKMRSPVNDEPRLSYGKPGPSQFARWPE